MLITLKNGDGIDPETIAAVRFGKRETHKSSLFGDYEHPPRVIVDFVQGDGIYRHPNSVVIDFDSDDEARAYQVELIAEVNAAVGGKSRELTTADKPVNFREFL